MFQIKGENAIVEENLTSSHGFSLSLLLEGVTAFGLVYAADQFVEPLFDRVPGTLTVLAFFYPLKLLATLVGRTRKTTAILLYSILVSAFMGYPIWITWWNDLVNWTHIVFIYPFMFFGVASATFLYDLLSGA